MTIGINLHNLVRPIIETLHPDEDLTLYTSIGQRVGADGVPRAMYLSGRSVRGQVQNLNDEGLEQRDKVSQNTDMRRIYLYAPDTYATPAPLERPDYRTGDLIQRQNGEWLLITCIQDDFRRVGWVCVCAVVQVYGVDEADIVPQLPAPTITPAGGNVTDPVEVTITSNPMYDDDTQAEPIQQIYFTLDGTDPTAHSTLYTASFTIDETMTVKAVACNPNYETSAVVSETYTFPEPEDEDNA